MLRMKIKGVLLLLMSAMLLTVLLNTKKIDNFPIGSVLPNLTFEGLMGKDSLQSDSSKVTVIIWLHPKCRHCQYQLNVIDKNIHMFDNVRLFLLSGDRKHLNKNHCISWPNLVKAGNVFFGIVDESKFTKEFGSMVTPSLLIFNRLGNLKKKFQGEVRLETILKTIDNLKVPEHIISGHN